MSTFNLANRIKITNPNSNIDSDYGPYSSVSTACLGVLHVVRQKGKTVGIIIGGDVVEYWWKSGILDSDLVEKSIVTDQNNTLTIKNVQAIDSQLNGWDVDEININILINDFFLNYSITVSETENILFDIPINFLEDVLDSTTYKFSEIRQYLFKLGKGIYINNITTNDLHMINKVKDYRFIDLYDITLTGNQGKIATVNGTEDSLDFKSFQDLISEGIVSDYVINLMDNQEIEIAINNKIIITDIEFIQNFGVVNINGISPIFPLSFNIVPDIINITVDNPMIINVKTIKYNL